jgi:hypothetical protein
VDMGTIGSASPASRAGSESGEMFAFAPIPTGTTASKGLDIDEVKIRSIAPAVAPTAIGADIEIGRATPLPSGSGCLTIGVHLTPLVAFALK